MNVETPEKCKAIIEDKGYGLQVTIPPGRSVIRILIIVFLCIWLVGWFIGGLVAIVTLIVGVRESLPTGINAFLFFWLIAWAIGVAFASFFLWFLMSKEIITLSQEIIQIERKALKLGRSRRYFLNAIKDFRVIEDGISIDGILNAYIHLIRNIYPWLGSKLAFDYGMKTVRFAGGIDGPEVEYILTLFKEKGIS